MRAAARELEPGWRRSASLESRLRRLQSRGGRADDASREALEDGHLETRGPAVKRNVDRTIRYQLDEGSCLQLGADQRQRVHAPADSGERGIDERLCGGNAVHRQSHVAAHDAARPAFLQPVVAVEDEGSASGQGPRHLSLIVRHIGAALAALRP